MCDIRTKARHPWCFRMFVSSLSILNVRRCKDDTRNKNQVVILTDTNKALVFEVNAQHLGRELKSMLRSISNQYTTEIYVNRIRTVCRSCDQLIEWLRKTAGYLRGDGVWGWICKKQLVSIVNPLNKYKLIEFIVYGTSLYH